MMGSKEFIQFAKQQVIRYVNDRAEKADGQSVTLISEDDVFVVWYCKTLQNHKALLSTTIPDGMYYELTYNGDKDEAYLDAYKKWQNLCIPIPVHRVNANLNVR